MYLLLLIPFLFSCSEEEKNENVQLEISTATLDFGKEGGSQTVYIYSNASWWNLMYNGGGWCDITPYSGSGNGSLQITVNENKTTNRRNTSVSISYGGSQISTSGTISLNISQDGLTNTGGNGNELSVPSGLNATQNGTSVFISWNSVSGVTNYNVYRSNSPSGTYSKIGSSNNANYTDNNPLSGYNYYKVSAVNNAGESTQSGSVYVNYNSSDGNETTKPSAPIGVTAKQNGTSISITWSSVSGATSYKVYHSNSVNGSYTQFTNSTNNTNWTDPAPFNGANYYKVKAINSAGESDFSSYAYCNYNSGDSGGETTIPNVPYGSPVIKNTTSNSLSLEWNASLRATGYKLYRATSANGYYSAVYTGANTTYTNTGLNSGTTYYYKVTATNSAGESEFSGVISGTTSSSGGSGGGTTQKLATPTGLEAFGQTGWSYVQISFNPVSLAYSYELYRATSASGSYSRITASGGSSGSRYVLTDSNPRTGKSYYKVKAIPLSTLNLTASDLSDYVSVTR